jgi:hypothetical protein
MLEFLSRTLRRNLAFWSMLALLAGMKLWAGLTPNVLRTIPFEPDDAYHATLKAEVLRECFPRPLEHCAGLASVDRMTQIQTQDAYFNFLKDRQRHRLLTEYHPIYTGLLFLGRTLGLESRDALVVVQTIGVLFATATAAYFLSVFFGTAAAIWGMAFLIVSPVSNHGIHIATHFTLAACSGLGLLAAIRTRARTGVIGAWAFLATGFHIAGLMCVGIAGLLLFFDRPLSEWKSKWTLKRATILAAASAFFLLTPIRYLPTGGGITEFYSVDFWTGLRAQVLFAAGLFRQLHSTFFATWGGADPKWIWGALAISLQGLGLFLWLKSNKRENAALALALAVGLSLGLLHRSDHASAIYRVWPLFAVFFAGIAGTLACTGWNTRMKGVRTGIIALFLAAGLSEVKSQSGWHVYFSRSENFLLPDASVEILRSTELPVVIDSNEPLAYALLNEALLRKEWSWVTLLKISPKGECSSLPTSALLATESPHYQRARTDLIFDASTSLKISGIQPNSNSVSFLASPSSIPLQVSLESSIAPINESFIEIAPRWIKAPTSGASSIELSQKQKPRHFIRILSIKTHENQLTAWPWDQGLSLRYSFPGRTKEPESASIHFESKNIGSGWAQRCGCKPGRILADQGILVIAELVCPHAN